MSQNAAAINAEIVLRLNRQGEISSTQVYDWMNRAKARVQTQAGFLDFMYHDAIVLGGSGAGTPGISAQFNPATVLLPPNFVSLRSIKVFTGATVSAAQIARIFGTTVTPYLFYFPTTCTAGTGLSTDHAGAGDLYPLWNDTIDFIDSDLTARGLTIDFDTLTGAYVDATILSRECASFTAAPTGEDQFLTATVGLSSPTANPRLSAASSTMTSVGYADTPWGGKFLTLPNWTTYFGEDDTDYRFMELGYYRTLPEYNTRTTECILAPTPTEDVFTRTAPDLLVEATLELAWQYLNDDVRREKCQVNVWGNQMLPRPNGLAYEFRKQHRIAQEGSGIDPRRRFKEGTVVARV